MQPIQPLKPCNCFTSVILGALVKGSGLENSVMKMNLGMITEVSKTNLDTSLKVMAIGGWRTLIGRRITTRSTFAKSSLSIGHSSQFMVNGKV